MATYGTLPGTYKRIIAGVNGGLFTSIDDIILDHSLACSCSFPLVYPTWLEPVVVRYQSVLGGTIRDFGRASVQRVSNLTPESSGNVLPPPEVVGERFLIHEDIVVTEFLVETIFHLFHAREDTIKVAVPRQDDDSCVSLPLPRRRHCVIVIITVRYGCFVGWGTPTETVCDVIQ
jgi:hypothetical protein